MSDAPSRAGRYRLLASFSLIALMVLCIAWEGMLAPIRPGGSWLILKVLPLLIPLFGILRGKRYTYQWASMFVLIYFTEGVVRAWSDRDLAQILAWLEVALSIAFFIAAIMYARLTAPSRFPTRQTAATPPAT
ncbi:MAG TPA: DUF2069 domain-containing protein [Usitatibacteraceae bacterium]